MQADEKCEGDRKQAEEYNQAAGGREKDIGRQVLNEYSAAPRIQHSACNRLGLAVKACMPIIDGAQRKSKRSLTPQAARH